MPVPVRIRYSGLPIVSPCGLFANNALNNTAFLDNFFLHGDLLQPKVSTNCRNKGLWVGRAAGDLHLKSPFPRHWCKPACVRSGNPIVWKPLLNVTFSQALWYKGLWVGRAAPTRGSQLVEHRRALETVSLKP